MYNYHKYLLIRLVLYEARDFKVKNKHIYLFFIATLHL